MSRETPTVNPQDMSIVLLVAAQNALGKPTYVVDAVTRAIHSQWYCFRACDKQQLVREILDYQTRERTLGFAFDTRAWLSIVERYQTERNLKLYEI